MTAAEMLRDWAIRARSICEAADARSVALHLEAGQVVTYELGAGLRYETAEGRVLEVPEGALDEERWAVAS